MLFRYGHLYFIMPQRLDDEFVGGYTDAIIGFLQRLIISIVYFETSACDNMTSNFPPILLTSCVFVSDQSVSLKDKDTRIRYTLESVEKWLAISPDLRLVICDGSNFDFSKVILEKFPGANIECIFFENRIEMVRLHGKGYGEGEIVNYALQHSASLKESDFFAKCTSKLWVENFFDCLEHWNGKFLCKAFFSNVFSLGKTRFEYVDTRFYLVSKSFYLKYLSTVYLNVGGEQGLSLEHCFRDVIRKEQFSKIMFNVPPVICGVAGGSGTYYKNNLKRRIKERIRLRIVKRDKSFSSLF